MDIKLSKDYKIRHTYWLQLVYNKGSIWYSRE